MNLRRPERRHAIAVLRHRRRRRSRRGPRERDCAATCRWCSRTRWRRWTRGCRSFDILAEPLRAHGRPTSGDRRTRVDELLALVGLDPEHADRYPARVLRRPAAADRHRPRAGHSSPTLVVLDEPVSALDVSIQAGVINLLDELKAELGLSYLFVAHDLAVVRHIADRVAVMYLGRIVEIGAVDEVFDDPAHPYTQALLSAIPLPDPQVERARDARSCCAATCPARPALPRVPVRQPVPAAPHPRHRSAAAAGTRPRR